MGEVLVVVVVLACLALLLTGLAWLAAHMRRRGLGGPMMGPFDEIWHPSAHQARIEVSQQEERGAPTPSPRNQ